MLVPQGSYLDRTIWEHTQYEKYDMKYYYYSFLRPSKPLNRDFPPRCLVQVYNDVGDKIGPLNSFFQAVEEEHHAKTGVNVSTSLTRSRHSRLITTLTTYY